MIENALTLKIPPGLFANGTKYQAKGRWRAANHVRFHEGTIRPVGGWQQRFTTGAILTGTAHAAISWQLEDGTPFLAIGTTTGLFVVDDNEVVYDITPTTIQDAPFNWQLSIFGTYLMATNSLLGDEDISLINVFSWIGDTGTPAAPAWTTAVGPRGAYAAFATPERYMTVLRGQDPTAAPTPPGINNPYSERRVYWASQETLEEFISTDTNTGGWFDLQTDGRLVVGAAARGQSLLWTDVDLWTMDYIGGTLIYQFKNVGSNCGIVSKRAQVLIDKGAFWMGRGKFFVYDGYVRNLPCEVSDAVFSDFNDANAGVVWALANPRFNEITWFYPSAGSAFPDKYVTFNHEENHWTLGSLTRTCGIQQRFRRDIIDAPVPLMINGVTLYDHETGNERDSQAYLESGPVELGEGDRLMRLQAIIPDDKAAGDVRLRLYTAMVPDQLETLRGPFALTTATALRTTARQVRVRLEEVTASDWRVGTVRLGVIPVERRGVGTGNAPDTTPVSIEIVPSSVTLIDSQSYTFTAIIRNAAGEVLDLEPDFWTSDNASQIPVNDIGTVTALVATGVAHITASLISPAITSNSATVTAAGDTTPASITITPVAADVIATQTQLVTAVVKNAAGQIITTASIDSWTTTDSAKATVASTTALTATVTGVAVGTTIINAHITSPALVSNDCDINVTTPYYTHTYLVGDGSNFTVTSGSGNVDWLVVAGGGSGAAGDGVGVGMGGGGAGGVRRSAVEGQHAVAVGVYTVTVGAGGVTPHIAFPIVQSDGVNGGNSSFDTITATGGGGGGSHDAPGSGGKNGGSGGGACTVSDDPASRSGGTGVAGQGFAGADGVNVSRPNTTVGGGGGGAGGVGATISGNGGVGVLDSISGVGTYYGGGGGGGAPDSGITGGAGGNGGGGAGSKTGGTLAGGTSGTANTGGGGGAGGGCQTPILQAGDGGSGIVIIRYTVLSGITATGGIKVLHS